MSKQIKLIIIYAIIMIAGPIGLPLAFNALMKGGIIPSLTTSQQNMLINIILYSILVIICLVLLRKELAKDISNAGRIIGKLIPMVFILYGASMVGSICINLIDHTSTSQNQMLLNDMKDISSLSIVLLAMIGSPIVEESVFRYGFIPKSKGFFRLLMLVISSLLFGLMHLHGFTPGALIAYSLLGGVFGLIYMKYENLFLNILVHMAYNGTSLALAFLAQGL